MYFIKHSGIVIIISEHVFRPASDRCICVSAEYFMAIEAKHGLHYAHVVTKAVVSLDVIWLENISLR